MHRGYDSTCLVTQLKHMNISLEPHRKTCCVSNRTQHLAVRSRRVEVRLDALTSGMEPPKCKLLNVVSWSGSTRLSAAC